MAKETFQELKNPDNWELIDVNHAALIYKESDSDKWFFKKLEVGELGLAWGIWAKGIVRDFYNKETTPSGDEFIRNFFGEKKVWKYTTVDISTSTHYSLISDKQFAINKYLEENGITNPIT